MEPFYTERNINIMLNQSLVNKAPGNWSGEDWRNYYRAFKQATLSPRQFAAQIYKGFSFSPCYKNGRRKKENFTEAHHIAFDFDDKGASLDYLMRNESFAWYFASFAYSTPSSTEETPKSRVIFILDNPITDINRYELIYAAMAQRFNDDGSLCDPQCKDGLRLYYGSKNAKMVGNWSVITDDMCQLWIDEYLGNLPPEPTKTETRRIAPDGDVGRAYLQSFANNIRAAGDGKRNYERTRNAWAAGGYVASGYIDESEAINVLVAAARSNTTTPDKAEDEIRGGIERGKNQPLYIEAKVPTDIKELI